MQFTTIGAAVVDIVVSRVQPMRGAKQDVEHIGLYAGGGAVNAALNVAARGAHVTVHACVGSDLEGDLLRDILRRHGIQAAIPDHPLPTGKAVVMVDESGSARAYAQRGASAWVGEQGFPGLEAADVVYVTGLSLESQAWLERSLARMAASRHRLAVTPGARQLANPQALLGLWERADLLCVNAREAAWLCGDAELDTDAPALDTARDLARRLVRRPGQSILVTLGQGGALFYDSAQGHDGEQGHFHPARTVVPVSTIGAGDAFASAFVHAWAGGAAPLEALAAATDSAARVIQVIPANLAGPLRT
ncbi:carbohydrate kinase family protein [Castellaniella defragrans]|uniref:Sugar/nucleoside kinase (Ribokinase family) n=1 Tax=Castellaniella defragrans TaxID=75697 RepID=A0A7W9WNT0_CASDE|nr:carbohydrate kinase family protein [Castellaniella defragrans]KAB0615107.1 carbohydrate kinase family protein [Castellaniella defragrans]MBB6083898.1 sugar/nucleoside kinase (ribokinase family) [Castellaniella defragrans]